ncbi:aldehyde dehydrogenase family protein [Kineococcus sp. R8]|uniref:aldehyde dehydrogenase (NADP(+)) n=1 Tax=Kineococcus siccus TaxID=2696567 RepID=UPI001412239A|nr:aldehyde dehydrogenase (NADP(+)) [Kineococcus siccus]NAZ83076.1 aldehyde dehydrogenase family protein [Kineococcus siccus]
MFLGASRHRGGAGEVSGVDPRTGETLSPAYGFADAADVDRAATLARDAFASYRCTAPDVRAAFLESVADRTAAAAEPVVARVVRETGIAEPRVRGELARTVTQLRLFAGVVREGSHVGARIENPLPDRTPLPRPDLRQRKVPLGPVAVFGAGNFPLAFSVAGGDTASALAAGCPVVVKAHSGHPGTSELVAAAIAGAVAEHGLHEGVFSMVYGGDEVGAALVSHPAVAAVGFTGSRAGGLALVALAAARPVPVPVYAEMSSTNPVVLLPAALAARGAALGAAFVTSLTTGVGQLCTNPGTVVALDGPGLEEFLGAAAVAVTGSPAQPMLGASTCAAYARGVAALRAHAGVEEVAVGGADDTITSAGPAALFTTDAETFLADRALSQEVFGACSLVVRARDEGQLTAVLRALEGQLTATLHADPADHPLARDLMEVLEDKAGRIVVNGWPTGVDVGAAMVHGGPFPATSDGRSTSVGTLAVDRFLRPVAYQDVPADLLPAAVAPGNPLGIWRQVDGGFGRD